MSWWDLPKWLRCILVLVGGGGIFSAITTRQVTAGQLATAVVIWVLSVVYVAAEYTQDGPGGPPGPATGEGSA